MSGAIGWFTHDEFDNEDARDAREEREREYYDEVVGYECPYCSHVHAVESSLCDGTDIACCNERGHCTPYTREDQHRDQKASRDWRRIATAGLIDKGSR